MGSSICVPRTCQPNGRNPTRTCPPQPTDTTLAHKRRAHVGVHIGLLFPIFGNNDARVRVPSWRPGARWVETLSLLHSPNRLKRFEFGTYSWPNDDTALETLIRNQPGLLELKLPLYLIQDHPNVLSACQSLPHLRHFYGETIGIPKETFREVLGTFTRGLPSLRYLLLSRWGQDDSLRVEVMHFQDIAPLLQCPFLEELRLWFCPGLDLDVQAIRQMGSAWTRLDALIIHAEGQTVTPLSYPVAFAESFPSLQRLASPFDDTKDPPPAHSVTARFKSLRRHRRGYRDMVDDTVGRGISGGGL